MRKTIIGTLCALGICWASFAAVAQEPARPGGQEARPELRQEPRQPVAPVLSPVFVQQPGQIALAAGAGDFDPNQPVRPGFQLSINVSSAAGPEPDLSGAFTVDPAGSVQLRLVGLVPIRGLTPSQAADKLVTLLRPYVRDPTVAVSIVSVPSPVVFLSGAVARSGATPVNDNTTLAELLTIVGLSDNADFSRVRVIRRSEGSARSLIEVDFLRWLRPAAGQRPDEASNLVLADRDFVFVPFKVLPPDGLVVVSGDVMRPAVIALRQGVPSMLREAVSAAGGLSPTAMRSQITVRRVGVERTFVIDYEKMEAGDPAHNIALQPEDVVYVQRLAEDQFITVNGGLLRPGRIPYLRAMTLTQAIGEAGGPVPGARTRAGRVFRHVGPADPTRTQVIAFNYEDIRNHKQPDLLLQAGDTIEVPIGMVRPPLDSLQLTQALLSIGLLVDRLVGGGRGRYW
ncbi:MAG TPA: SLBB domain-containing protein [Chthonomonadales bacterium]|nr:SLBB domain-containing protein [Chthonomonadales bacterium]